MSTDRSLEVLLWAVRGASPPDWSLLVEYGRDRRRPGRTLIPIPEIDQAARMIRVLGRESEVRIGPVPRVRRSDRSLEVAVGFVAWAEVPADQVPDLDAFPARPSFEIATGDRLTALWVLDRPEPAHRIEAVNNRLAEHLGVVPSPVDALLRAPDTDYPEPCRVIERRLHIHDLDDLLAERVIR